MTKFAARSPQYAHLSRIENKLLQTCCKYIEGRYFFSVPISD